MRFLNLMSKAVMIEGVKGAKGCLRFEPFGAVADGKVVRFGLREIDGVPVTKVESVQVRGLPSPVKGTCFVVVQEVRLEHPWRLDLLSPGEGAREVGGEIMCRSLDSN